MHTADFTACPLGRIWAALDRCAYRPVTIPGRATFTDDSRRAVAMPKPFSARRAVK